MDLMFCYDVSNENKYGICCVGEVVVVVNNLYCIVGIVFNVKIGGV